MLAIRTAIPPDVWERQAEGAIETALQVLREDDQRRTDENGEGDADSGPVMSG